MNVFKTLQKYLRVTVNKTEQPIEAPPTTHEVFYKNQFNNSYKTDDRIMKDLIYNNVKCTNEKLELIIYYASSATGSLILKTTNHRLPLLCNGPTSYTNANVILTSVGVNLVRMWG